MPRGGELIGRRLRLGGLQAGGAGGEEADADGYCDVEEEEAVELFFGFGGVVVEGEEVVAADERKVG